VCICKLIIDKTEGVSGSYNEPFSSDDVKDDEEYNDKATPAAEGNPDKEQQKQNCSGAKN
jgi:hypothetical protein